MDWEVLFFKVGLSIETVFFFLSCFVLVLYTVSILFLFTYSLVQAQLLLHYRKARKTALKKPMPLEKLPKVTIQLPVFNEQYVVERLLETVSNIDYPKDLLQIQVLDDSTDASLTIAAQKIKTLQKQGIPIEHVLRPHRKGFKAGALKYGLEQATGDFIAIFDADFMPQKDWLRKTVPHFSNPEVGVVQTRWGHLNRNFSILTETQAFVLDAHFTLEQTGRNHQNAFINFNGTGGIWRKACILDAGNWEGNTLTEDLDLSYRAQLRKWKIKYLQEVVTPAELPVAMSAIRSQQFRWQKGGAENFRKLAGSVWRSKNITFKTKFHGLIHLLSSSMFLNTFVVSVLSVPFLYIKAEWQVFQPFFNISSVFLLSLLILMVCYGYIYRENKEKQMDFLKKFTIFYTLALGFSAHNAIAVMQGFWGRKTAFVRTPKFNVTKRNDTWKNNSYLLQKQSGYAFMELALSVYFLWAVYSAFRLEDYGLIAFHFLLFLGFGIVGGYSLFKTK